MSKAMLYFLCLKSAFKICNSLNGDWSIGKQMRNFISTPNLTLKRKLKMVKNLTLYNLNK